MLNEFNSPKIRDHAIAVIKEAMAVTQKKCLDRIRYNGAHMHKLTGGGDREWL